jgi:hypothetical protein
MYKEIAHKRPNNQNTYLTNEHYRSTQLTFPWKTYHHIQTWSRHAQLSDPEEWSCKHLLFPFFKQHFLAFSFSLDLYSSVPFTTLIIDSSLPFSETKLAVSNSPRNKFPKTETIPVGCGGYWSHPHHHLAPSLIICNRVQWIVCVSVPFQHKNAMPRSGPWIPKKKKSAFALGLDLALLTILYHR